MGPFDFNEADEIIEPEKKKVRMNNDDSDSGDEGKKFEPKKFHERPSGALYRGGVIQPPNPKKPPRPDGWGFKVYKDKNLFEG